MRRALDSREREREPEAKLNLSAVDSRVKRKWGAGGFRRRGEGKKSAQSRTILDFGAYRKSHWVSGEKSKGRGSDGGKKR